MGFLGICVVGVLAFLFGQCRGKCSHSEINNLPGFSLGVGHVFKAYSTPNIFLCMELCMRYPMCRSVDVNRNQGECKLHVKSSVEAPHLLIPTNNVVHVDKENFPTTLLADVCGGYSCDNNTMCVASTGCVPTVGDKSCGSPPSVSNAEASPPGPFPVGHTHKYTCSVEYVPFYEPYTTCQENGKWTDVVFHCKHRCVAIGNAIVGTSWCYLISDKQVNYNQAKIECANRGMSMPKIESRAEWDALRWHLQPGTNFYWIGGYARNTGLFVRAWFWEDGELFGPFQPWMWGQPDNLFFQQFNIWVSQVGWDDTAHWTSGRLLCEKNF